MRRIAFRKMHGLGNDFVVIDQRREASAIDEAAARALADRHTGIGCDLLILIEPPRDPAAQIFMRLLNADGSEAEACGNGARCIARLVAEETGERHVRLETLAGLLDAELLPDRRVAVDMGPARTGWRDIPLARAMDTLCVDLAAGALANPVCTSIGNPHATFFVGDAEAVDLAALGPFSSTTRCSPSAPISGSRRCAATSGSGCASGSAAPGSPRPAAAAPAPPSLPPIAAG